MIAGFGFRALPLNRAIICSSLAGFLLLPSAITADLPGLPDLDKYSVVFLGIIATYLTHRRRGPVESVPRLSLLLMAILLVSALGTVLTNGDPLVDAQPVILGLTMYDALGMTFRNILIISVVTIGVRTLSRAEDHREMLLLFGSAMVLYSLPALLELRISPQLHRWVYGIHAAGFVQQVRGDGFRATVFLSNGLVMAWFLAMGSAGMMALRKSGIRVFGFRPGALSAYLWVVLVLQKSLGALMIGSLMNLSLLLRPRRQVGLATAIAVIFLVYPVIRGAGLVPTAWINSTVAEYSSERSQSFGVRLTNEDQLLAKANQRPWFGWGDWGRGRVYDPESGRNTSVTDGAWIITLGNSGWVGYITQFGLICLPLLGLYRYRRKIPLETAGLAIILSGNLIDMIPNSSITPITWLTAGALTGALAAARRSTATATAKKLDVSAGMEAALEGTVRPA